MNRIVAGAWPLIVATVTAGACTAALAQTPTAQGGFTDDLNAFDSTRWMKADGWSNGSPFYNAWLADHISHANGTMSIRLDDVAALGMPYSSGNLQSNGFYGYGCYEARFKPVAQSGVVSSFFTFAGPYDNGGNGQHNEIDIEFLGYDTTRFQVNYWTNDDSYTGGNEHRVDAGFDASLDFHNYGFKWTATGIEWFVDGVSVYKVDDSLLHPTPKAADSLHKVMMNVWPVDSTAEGWAGAFNYPSTPLYGEYDWIKYTAGENCVIGGSATDMHVQSIALSLNSKKTQAIAKISLVDDLGQPVANAAVSGAWSGLVSGGAQGTTNTKGTVSFTSAKFSGSGTLSLCVTNVTASGKRYAASANVETCDSILK